MNILIPGEENVGIKNGTFFGRQGADNKRDVGQILLAEIVKKQLASKLLALGLARTIQIKLF